MLHFYRAMNGYIPPETPDPDEFPVRGIDISHYQGDIDWNILSQEDHVQFAFIKATEGREHKDPKFLENWNAAQESDVFVGAYHFFTFGSTGKEQAENFIDTVPIADNVLPPVIDVEIYEAEVIPEKKDLQKELDVMLDMLESHYGVKPIIYTNSSTYISHLLGGYLKYDIWMSNLYCEPIINWTFWQYNFEGKLKGFAQEEIPVDLNVYNGNLDEFLSEFNLVYKKEN